MTLQFSSKSSISRLFDPDWWIPESYNRICTYTFQCSCKMNICLQNKCSVKQSDRNSSKKNFFVISLQHINNTIQNYEEKKTFARHEYDLIGVFRIQMRSLIKKL